MTKSLSPNKNKPILEIVNLCKSYQLGETTVNALCEVSFKIFEGDFISIVGPSGSGKSTFLQLASLLDKPTSGSIFIRGKQVKNFKEKQLAFIRNKEFGFVFQQFNLLKKTSALENVSLPLIYAGIPKPQREKKAKEVLEKVGLGDRLKNSPAQLSGGQQQRVAIARALVNDPAIIFADEPTGNLDSKTGEDIIKLLKDLNKEGKTIVVVTHEEEVAQATHKRITLRDGKISDQIFRGK